MEKGDQRDSNPLNKGKRANKGSPVNKVNSQDSKVSNLLRAVPNRVAANLASPGSSSNRPGTPSNNSRNRSPATTR